MHISPEIDRVCTTAIDNQLKRILNGNFHLKIPILKGLMLPGKGRHYHFTPEIFIQLSGGT